MIKHTATQSKAQKPHRRIRFSFASFGSAYKVGFYLTILMFVLSLGLRMYFTNTMTVKGKELAALDAQKIELDKEVSKLSLEISKYTSMTYVENQATTLGFIEYKQPVAVVSSTPVAALTILR